MSANRLLRRGVLIVVLLAALVGVVPAAPAAPVRAQSSGLGAGGEYHPLTPTRILDTRNPALDVAPAGKKATGPGKPSFNFTVLGKGGVPSNPADVLAVVVSVVVVGGTQPGYLNLFPAGENAGTASLINFQRGRSVPNLAIVGVGNAGKLTALLYSQLGGRAHVVADVYGWVSTSSAAQRGARVVSTIPGRIYDSRKAGSGAPLGNRASVALPIRGADGRDANYQVTAPDVVPNSNRVTGVIVNLTAINNHPGSQPTYMSLTPTPVSGSGASTSNVNAVAGQVKPVMAIVPVGSDGRIHLYNHRGPAHVAVDVLGYLQTPADPASSTGRIVPLESPFRVFDTRLAAFGNVRLGTRQAENWSFKSFVESVTLGGVSVGSQGALFGNLTGTGLQRRVPWQAVSTYLSMYPAGRARPFTSNINVVEKESVPNMALVSYGTVKNASGVDDPYVAQAFNYNGSLHYLLDVFAVILK